MKRSEKQNEIYTAKFLDKFQPMKSNGEFKESEKTNKKIKSNRKRS